MEKRKASSELTQKTKKHVSWRASKLPVRTRSANWPHSPAWRAQAVGICPRGLAARDGVSQLFRASRRVTTTTTPKQIANGLFWDDLGRQRRYSE